jgi:Zn-dependent peptidase ImmA (M78 family)/transcriptional regulator with XRE-family HTH domain
MALSREQIAARLRQQRDGLGLTQAAVAAELGVHRPTISEIEAGRRAVTAEELYRLSTLYGASVAEILAEAPAEAVEAAELLALRSDDADSPGARLALKRFVADRKAEFELEELLGLAHPTVAAIRREAPKPSNTMDAVEQGESLATLERRHLGLGAEPAGSILHLLARQGVRIGPLRALPTDRIDGVYFESADLGPCVGVNWRDGDWTGGRAAFTAAHEYAHVILRDRAREVFHLAAGERDLQEVRANAFAAAFLMPADGLSAYFTGKGLLRGQALTHLAPADVVRAMDYFGVSRSALLFRLQNIGMISPELAGSLNAFIVTSVAEAAGVTFRERKYIGTRLPELAIHAWRLGHVTTGRAAELCELDVQAFRDLMRDLGEEQELAEHALLIGASAGR